MDAPKTYTIDEVSRVFLLTVMLLDNGIFLENQGEIDMAKRLKQQVTINGEERWVTGLSIADLLENYRKLLTKEVFEANQNGASSILFGDYMTKFVKTYKSDQATTTMVNRDRIMKNHILPRFGNTPIDQISIGDIQQWFNELAETYSKETIKKIKALMGPVFDGAVEDGHRIAMQPSLCAHW